MTERTVTIELETPVEFAGDLITEIVLRRPTGKDLRMAMKGKNSTEDSIALAARVSGQMPAVFDLLDGADITEILSAVGNLLQRGQ